MPAAERARLLDAYADESSIVDQVDEAIRARRKPCRAATRFCALHVWAWRTNPNGMFADFNPKVSCEDFHQAPASTSSAPGARH